MKCLIALLMLIVTCYCATLNEVFLSEWTEFKLKHGKKYETRIEEEFRMKIFLQTKHEIAKHNAEYELGLHTYTLGMNKFGDMLRHEFTEMMNGFDMNSTVSRQNGSTFITPANVVIPAEVDWRKKGAVTPVKDQGMCGSCWAFSSTGSLEGQHYLKTGVLTSLSEQNLVDCSRKYGNGGCSGGFMSAGFLYIKDNHGIDTEASYPYEAKDDICRYSPKTVGAIDTGYVGIPMGSEEKLKEAVATVGPVSVAIDASRTSFMLYRSGVYCDVKCSSVFLDHAVLVVGYGTDEKTKEDYWLVKNSWGTVWGDKGYIKMCRNKMNHCGIATTAVYPLV